MKTITKDEAGEWCHARGIPLNKRGLPAVQDIADASDFPIPNDAGERTALVKDQMEALTANSTCLVWLDDWSVCFAYPRTVQNPTSALRMNALLPMKTFRTPRKYGQLVIAPSYKAGAFDSHATDCPFPFFHDGKFWMTYVGWDGIGYQTGLASSDNLLAWKKEGLLLGRGPKGSVTEYNAALTCILRENELFGSGTLKRVNGRFVGTYNAYPEPGYETGPAVIGLCYSDDLRSWDVCPPVLEPDPSCEWEAGGLYKSWVLESEGMYYLFYNAKNRTNGPWVEQTGFATSRDLVHWERFQGNPALRLGASGDFDDRFASDPCVLRHEGTWIMFYFGLCSDGHARDGVAFSDDLQHWRKAGEVLIDVGAEGSIDCRHAHKPGIISQGNRLYHFYCAVAPSKDSRLGEIEHDEVRGIALATN